MTMREVSVMLTAAYRSIQLAASFMILGIVVGSFWFTLNGLRALSLGLVGVFTYSLVMGLRAGSRWGFGPGLNVGFVGGLAAGLAVGALYVFAPQKLSTPNALFATRDIIAVTLAMNFALNLVRPPLSQSKRLLDIHFLMAGAESGAWIGGLFGFLHSLVVGGGLGSAFTRGVILMLSGGVCGAITSPAGRIAAHWLKPRLEVFDKLMPYLREMWVPLGGFALGYFAIVFLFACSYGVAWRTDPRMFSGMPANASFGYFFYFSLATISTLGYTTIVPASAAVKTLVSIEVVLGIGWITVFLAALIAYLQPRFARLDREREKSVHAQIS
jgi:hypothetical protein